MLGGEWITNSYIHFVFLNLDFNDSEQGRCFGFDFDMRNSKVYEGVGPRRRHHVLVGLVYAERVFTPNETFRKRKT